MPDWEPTLSARLTPHKELLCGEADWGEETPAVRAMIGRFKAKQCKGFVRGVGEEFLMVKTSTFNGASLASLCGCGTAAPKNCAV